MTRFRLPLARARAALCTGLLASVAAACAHAPSVPAGGAAAARVASAEPAPPTPRPVLSHDARSIGFAEMTLVRNTTAYDVVRLLRPEFLRPRYPSVEHPGGQYAVVYVDDRYEGDIEALRSLPASGVARIRYLTPGEAGQRYGMIHDHRGGVILVQIGRR